MMTAKQIENEIDRLDTIIDDDDKNVISRREALTTRRALQWVLGYWYELK
jgi:hypothetical protein